MSKARAIHAFDSAYPIFSSTLLHLLSDFSISVSYSVPALPSNPFVGIRLHKSAKTLYTDDIAILFVREKKGKALKYFFSRGLVNYQIYKNTYTVILES